ncbi:RagB/SusD family nutrient uptake outer membrane protein [Chitinophaga pendula]|uniref:RagB/SusD family nutrient uptake outer membrane protein n=1 Tax=Chitinophaga TaxID=79328 RepID=UPI0018DFAAF5|nr:MULTISPECIES: RagB/SusD family nutrient uptake outer membrane protein [Chitinophaga]UCJ06994.1 RagB/SusD family nutrient uptake outer membrane protein [Chitinophaga pendula]
MKKNILTFGIAGVLLLFGCTKKLDRLPYDGLINDIAFNLPSDFQNAVRGMYSGLAGLGFPSRTPLTRYTDGEWLLLGDILADDVITCSVGRNTFITLQSWSYNSNNTSNLYLQAYNIILRSNSILANIENKVVTGAEKNNIQGEALAMRALVHFDLVKLYGKSYTSATADDLGVSYVTSIGADLQPSRDKVRDVYDKIVKDLTDALPLIASNNGVGRLNKASVYGLLSRVYLYREEWLKVIDASTEALKINGNPADTADFPKIWKDETEVGVLFKIKMLDKDKIAIGVLYSQASSQGVRSEYVANRGLTQLYDTLKDVRAKYPSSPDSSSTFKRGTFASLTSYYVTKYLGRATGNANVVDFKYLRVAEVLLNRAEAYAMLGMDALAQADLNKLRDNRIRGNTPYTGTGDALKAEIANERRRELAFEAFRFFDLKRKNLPINRPDFGDAFDGSGRQFTNKQLPANSPKFQLPIPQEEINANPNTKQNPGY